MSNESPYGEKQSATHAQVVSALYQHTNRIWICDVSGPEVATPDTF